ncbi:hypothetical protein ACFE04_030585 [Oxalis oulophora]
MDFKLTSSFSSSSLIELEDEDFDSVVQDSPLMIVGIFLSWCPHCNILDLTYKKAATILFDEVKEFPFDLIRNNLKLAVCYSTHLVKKHATTTHSHPQIKLFRDQGKRVDVYNGPDDAYAIVDWFKIHTLPFPIQISLPLNLDNLPFYSPIKQNTMPIIVGIFPTCSGVEYDNFIKVVHQLQFRLGYNNIYKTSINHYPISIPDEESSKTQQSLKKAPVVQVFTPEETTAAETSTFDVHSLVQFIEESITPLVTIYKKDPRLDAAFFSGRIHYDKAMLFTDFNHHDFRLFEKAYREVAKKERGISFMLVDSAVLEHDFLVFELHKSPTPLIVIRAPTGETYLKADLTPGNIETWVGDCKVRSVTEYGILAQEKKDGHVMMVSADNFQEEVMDSGKHGYWCHWCGPCKDSARVLNDVALHLEKGVEVVIAKLVYKNARDVRIKYLDDSLKYGEYPTLCFKRAGRRKLYVYYGLIKEDSIIQFIYNNLKHKPATKLVGDGENIVILDHMRRDVARTIYSDSEMGKKFDFGSRDRLRTIYRTTEFDETIMDPRLNVLLIFYGSTWMSENQKFEDALRKLADEFDEEKMCTELVIDFLDEIDVESYCTIQKALVQVMHHFKTFNVKDEPTIFFKTASGKLVAYDYDDITVENVESFIRKHMEFDINLESKTNKTLFELSSQFEVCAIHTNELHSLLEKVCCDMEMDKKEELVISESSCYGRPKALLTLVESF